MESKSKKTRGTQVQSQVKPQVKSNIEKDLGPLMKAIDNAVDGISDPRKRQEARQAVGEAVHDAVRHLARRSAPLMPSKVPPQEVKTQAISEATAAIKTVKDLGFVEFTAGLIHGSFDAIIDATIKQMKAYSDLVADLAKTLTQFEAERVSPADVTLYLAKSYPDGAGGTSVNSGYKFKKKPAKPNAGYAGETAKEQLNKVGQALVLETSGLADAYKISFDPLTHATGTDDEASFTQAFVLDVYPKISKLLAKTMIEHLRAMAREGMARIVVTDGELLTKLTFRVEATEIEAKQTSDYHQDGFSLNFGAGFKSARFRASLGIGYSSINCSSVNTQNFDAANMSAEIIGQVRIKFHTQTFAPIIKDEPIA